MLLLDEKERAALWQKLTAEIENYIRRVEKLPVAPRADVAEIRTRLASIDFEQPVAPLAALEFAVRNLTEFQVHTPHPRYYGLFNPAPATMGIAADFLVAAFNPQLAAWSHSPFPVEVEDHLVRAFGGRLGYDPAGTDGTFTSGGAEANHTAVLAALQATFPEWAERGVRALPGQPTMYVSTEGHHSLAKA